MSAEQDREPALAQASMPAGAVFLSYASEIDPTYDWGYTTVGTALMWRGDPAQAIIQYKRQNNQSEQAFGLALAYHTLGRAADSNAALRSLIASGASNYAYEVAEVYAYRGEPTDALKWLERAYTQKDATLKWILKDPPMADLASDPRYKAFLRKMKPCGVRRTTAWRNPHGG